MRTKNNLGYAVSRKELKKVSGGRHHGYHSYGHCVYQYMAETLYICVDNAIYSCPLDDNMTQDCLNMIPKLAKLISATCDQNAC
ncbi:MAG: hypothetical protein QM535_22390 [Limnohabitans sp.]|nr:hypothetical protein [Limnohabitans sp.]